MEEYNLQEIRIEDYNSIKEYYQMRRPETADSNILDLYIWLNCYPTWYFTNDKGLMWVAKSEDGQYYSSIPCCKDEDLKECFLETQKYFNEVLQKKLVMYVVDKAAVDLLQLPEDEYEFKFLSKKDEPEILAFLEDWKKHKSDTEEHEFIDSEAVGIKYILEHEEVFDYKIGAVYVDNKLEAFTIGNYESREDMVYIPVEKANPEIRGLYPYICSQFLIEAFPEAGKENREDDMGLEGLRKSKLSYNPIYMVEKYTIIQK